MKAKDLEAAIKDGTLLALAERKYSQPKKVRVVSAADLTTWERKSRGPQWNAVDADTGNPISVYDKARSVGSWRSYQTTNIPSRCFLGEWGAVMRARQEAADARRREFNERAERDHANRVEMEKVAEQIREFLDRDDLIITPYVGGTGSNSVQGIKILLAGQHPGASTDGEA